MHKPWNIKKRKSTLLTLIANGNSCYDDNSVYQWWSWQVGAVEKLSERWLMTEMCCRETSLVALISLLVSVGHIARWRETATTTHCCCCVERRVVMWVRCNIIVLAATAWLESLCRRGRVVVVVDCSAVECDDSTSQRPTRDLHCLMTSDEAPWRRQMTVEL